MASKEVPFYPIQANGKNHDSEFFITQQDAIKNEQLPHRHDHYLIYAVINGITIHQLDFKEYTVEAPGFIFISPGQIHSMRNAEHSDMVAIAFKPGFLLGIDSKSLDHLFHTSLILIKEEEFDEVRPYLDLLQREFQRNLPQSNILTALLTAFLEKCEAIFHQYHSDDGERYNQIFQQFLALIDEKFKQYTKVTDYASLLFLTSGHLNDIVKQISGKSAKTFIDERRVLEARRLLYWTENSIKNIAWDLGFEDAAYFTRYFKRHTSDLPKKFRLRVNKRSNN